MRLRHLTTAVLLVSALALAGCGDDDNPGSVNSTTSAAPTPEETDPAPSVTSTPSPSETSSPSPSETSAPTPGPNDFTMTTKDGSVEITGPVTACENPDETSLETEFSDGSSTVDIDVERGRGEVDVEGATQFEGRVSSIQVGDTGMVTIAGKGGLSDDSAPTTAFMITGTCP